MSGPGEPVTYVLPLRWDEGGPIDELAAYLRSLEGEVAETIVVDGSDPAAFARHHQALVGVARHVPPHDDLHFRMGKVDGVITGVRESSHELVVLADDDVRYTPASLGRVVEKLHDADLVRPQNYFVQLPWHAYWDTARTLLNRVFAGDLRFPVGDFPGTLAVRRSVLLGLGGYDGDALFENLELMRTIEAAGGSVSSPLDLYVARLPPSTGHFRSQRVRQAYDDFAIPGRLSFFLGLGPLVVALLLRRRWTAVATLSCAVAVVAEAGRRRAGGAERFPIGSSVLAPGWVVERSVCAWLAVGARLRGGARYGDGRIRLAANSSRTLRRRLEARSRP